MEENNEIKNEELLEDEEFELSHADKLAGIFTEPKVTFEKIAKFPPKITDWLIPLFLLAIVAVFSNIIMMSNPVIKYQVIEEQISKMEKEFDKAVEEGTISREEAESRIESARDMMEGGAVGMVIQSVGTVFVLFIIFFLISFVFHVIAKFVLGGQGSYSASMVAYGLSFYISIIQVIIMVLAAMLADKLFTDLSIATFLDMDKHTFVGFLLSKADIISIWFYGIFAIGLAKMHGSDNTKKYMAMVYGVWIGFSLLLFFVSKTVPFFGNFIR